MYAGFLHQDRERHPTVASDMMEEWRSVLIDSMVMSLINGYEVEKSGFRREENGVFLDDKTFKIFLKKYETKLRTSTGYLNYGDEKVSFRKALWLQASKLAKAIDEGYIIIDDDHYKWTLNKVLLAYMCGRIYCEDYPEKTIYDEKTYWMPGRVELFPGTELDKLFNMKDLTQSRHTRKKQKLRPQDPRKLTSYLSSQCATLFLFDKQQVINSSPPCYIQL